jgi:hypothetical protein
MNDLALAVWFMDDGGSQYAMAKISTYAFLVEDLELMTEYLNKRGFFCKVYYEKQKGPIITFSSTGANHLMKVISPFIHPHFHYKVQLNALKGKQITIQVPTIFGQQRQRTCQYCGAMFIVRKSQKFCGKRMCYLENMRNLQKKWRSQNPRPKETIYGKCIICNKEFQRIRYIPQSPKERTKKPQTCSRICQAHLIAQVKQNKKNGCIAST